MSGAANPVLRPLPNQTFFSEERDRFDSGGRSYQTIRLSTEVFRFGSSPKKGLRIKSAQKHAPIAIDCLWGVPRIVI